MPHDMTKILHVTPDPLEMDGRLLRYKQAADAAGYEVDILEPDARYFVQIVSFGSKIHAALRYLPTSLLGKVWLFVTNRFSSRLGRLADEIVARQPDLIHAHNWETCAAGINAATRLGVPIIFDVHEFASGMSVDRPLWHAVFSKHIECVEQSYLDRAHAVVTISDSLAAFLQQKYSLKRLPLVVRNLPPFCESTVQAVNPDRIVIHYHGMMNRDRNLERLIKAISLLPGQYVLKLAGRAHDQVYEDSLKSLIKRLGLDQRIIWHGPFANEDAVNIGRGCDIGYAGMLPERKYQSLHAFPNKVSEYIMSGLAVVGGGAIEFKRLNTLYKFGVVSNNRSAEEIAAAIVSIEPAQLQEMKANALKLSKELNWDKEQERILSLYEDLLKGRNLEAS